MKQESQESVGAVGHGSTAITDTPFRELIDSLPQLVWTCLASGPCDYLSRQWVDYTGIPAEPQLGYGWLDQLHPDDRERTVREWEQKVKTGDQFDIHFRIRNASGAYRWFQTRAVPLRGGTGAIVKWLGSNTDVDDLRRTEEAFRESEARYREIVTTASEGIWTIDAQACTSFVNPKMAEMLGYSEAEMLGRLLTDFMDDEGRAIIEKYLERRRQGIVENHDFKFRHRSGDVVWVSMATNPMLDAEGAYVGALAMVTNVTERRKVEQELWESELRNRAIVDAALDGLITIDDRGTIVGWSLQAEGIFGWSKEQALGRGIAETIMPLAFPEEHEEGMRLMLGGGGAPILNRRDEFTAVARGGREFPIELTIASIPTQNGTQYCAFVRDISGRKETEAALRLNEERLRTVVEASPNGLIVVDERGVISLANAKMEHLFGYAVDRLLGQTVDLLLPESKREAHHRDFHVYLQNPTVRSMGSRSRVEGRRQDGTLFPAEVSLHPINMPEGQMVLATITDVTERQAMTDQLEASLLEKETLLREIHHRVKNNLQIISSLLYFQSKKVQHPDDQIAFTEGRDRLRSMILVHEMLYQSRDLSQVDLSAYLRGLMSDLRDSYSAQERQTEVRVESEPIQVEIEMALSCGMITNELVTNAFKYAFPSNRGGAILVSAKLMDGHLDLAVRDNGVGLPEGFDCSAPSSFGWQLITNLARKHDGLVSCSNQDGTLVTISFPFQPTVQP